MNSRLLDTLDSMPNVKLLFNHKLTGADFKAQKAWFETRDRATFANGRAKEIEVDFDFMIGADGAHSAVRYHMMKFTRMDYQQEYIDTLWCEFRIDPQVVQEGEDYEVRFQISPNHLHIWPGKEFMFIAIPSEVSYHFIPKRASRLVYTTGWLVYLHFIRLQPAILSSREEH